MKNGLDYDELVAAEEAGHDDGTLNSAIDHYSWFKETLLFSDEDLQEEILAQIASLKGSNPAEGAAFEKAIEGDAGEETLFRVKKAITEVAILFSGALAISKEQEFTVFAAKVLAESEKEGRFPSLVRSALLTASPNEAREDVREQLKTQFKEGSKELRRAQIQYDMRLDNFIDAYRKQQSARTE